MADHGTPSQVFNNENVKLQLSPDNWVLCQEKKLHLEKEEYVEETDLGNIYFYGNSADNWVEYTILVSRPEFATLETLHTVANGTLPKNIWKFVGTDIGGGTVGATLTFNGTLPVLDYEAVGKGGFKCRIRIRITDNAITVT